MTDQRSYGEVSRELDLLKAGVELALPQLDRVGRFIVGGGDRFEAQMALEKAKRDLTIGVD